MAQSSPPEEALLGEISSSKFKILRLLGAGGMGAVYEAEHVFTKRHGALKLLHSHFAEIPQVVERFTREASAAGRIQNPHIVETFDAGRLESGHPYMFMELLAGTALDSLLKERGALPFEEAIGLCAQAAAGLAAAHKSGIIHRDIKPANLFLVEGKGTLVKLLDFGISKFSVVDEVSQVTQEGATLGTPYYMPPEQVMGSKNIDEGVDIYALGVVLYETVTGSPPYVAETLPALSVRIYEGRYTPVSSLRADTPPGFDEVLARCLAVDRAQRYATVADLLVDLLALIGRHAESLAPTLMVGSPLPMLSSPPPYSPSQPPVWSGAGRSARPGPLSGDPSSPPPGHVTASAGSASAGAAANGQAVGQSLLPPGPSIVPPASVPWLWIGLAAAVALGVAGYFAFGGKESVASDVSEAAASATAANVGNDGVPSSASATGATPSVHAVNTNVGSDLRANTKSSAPEIATSAGSTQPADEQTPGGKNSSPGSAHSSAKPGASSGVRQPTNNGNVQSGLKRENPFE